MQLNEQPASQPTRQEGQQCSIRIRRLRRRRRWLSGRMSDEWAKAGHSVERDWYPHTHTLDGWVDCALVVDTSRNQLNGQMVLPMLPFAWPSKSIESKRWFCWFPSNNPSWRSTNWNGEFLSPKSLFRMFNQIKWIGCWVFDQTIRLIGAWTMHGNGDKIRYWPLFKKLAYFDHACYDWKSYMTSFI